MPRRNEPTERTCIVTREVLPTDRLIRFVAAPDGTLVADLRRRLPGRGVWVTARAAEVTTAERKKMFGRALGEPVTVAPGLADRVAEALREAALAALSLARKAGSAVAGFGKVEAAVSAGEAIALVHADSAAADGVEKLTRLAKSRFGHALPSVGIFTGDQLDLAFGRPNVIHAALLAGPAGANALSRVRAFVDFFGGDGHANDIHDPLPEARQLPAEP